MKYLVVVTVVFLFASNINIGWLERSDLNPIKMLDIYSIIIECRSFDQNQIHLTMIPEDNSNTSTLQIQDYFPFYWLSIKILAVFFYLLGIGCIISASYLILSSFNLFGNVL